MKKIIGYSTFDITKILGIPSERLQDWMKRNFVKPSIMTAKGKGTKNLFSVIDLYKIELFSMLRKVGFKRQAITNVLQSINDSGELCEQVSNIFTGLSIIDKDTKSEDHNFVSLVINWKYIVYSVDTKIMRSINEKT